MSWTAQEIPEILSDAANIDLDGDAGFELELSIGGRNPADQIPILGDVLPAQLAWEASASYAFAMDDSGGDIDGTGNSPRLARRTWISMTSSSTSSISSSISSIVQSAAAKLPGFLGRPINLLGDKTLLELMGLGDFELVVNPHAVLDRSLEDRSADDLEDEDNGISFSFGSNLVESLLSGQPTNLIEVHGGEDSESIPIGEGLFPRLPGFWPPRFR
ncbi:MAG: hypothetical protein U1D30_13830 [Planctomycetota bacterium]